MTILASLSSSERCWPPLDQEKSKDSKRIEEPAGVDANRFPDHWREQHAIQSLRTSIAPRSSGLEAAAEGEWGEVESCRAVDDQVGDGFADRGREFEPVA